MLHNLRVLTALTILTFDVRGSSLSTVQKDALPTDTVAVDPFQNSGRWQGWGSSLAWWARAIGGTGNADYYADLIYTTDLNHGYPGLGLNIVRYNVGGGGMNQPSENKGTKLQWQMDIHGYWTNPESADPSSASWNWALDSNQRTMMLKAQARGANVFEMFSDSPMWWMNSNHSTAGSDSGGDCLDPANYNRFSTYLATVARYSAQHWGVKFASVEPFNEPSATWWKYPVRQEGCHFDVGTQTKIVRSLRTALDERHLTTVAVAASDENDFDVALSTWNSFDATTRRSVGKLNAHGYYQGTESYRGPNRSGLRDAVGDKRLWQSEYGDGDGSGYTMANSIVQDIRSLRPSAWIYWQPVEPDVKASGWGLLNANYVDTGDSRKPDAITRLVRVNRKFFVYGQFTRYLRPGFQLIGVSAATSIAAYDSTSEKLVLIAVTGDTVQNLNYDLSKFSKVGDTIQQIVTTTSPGNGVPDWKQHIDALSFKKRHAKAFAARLYPKSVYTFVIEGVLP
jgi:galactan endo-1,6-beta-galactosidase